MNILFITHYPHLYGSIRSVIDLADGLEALGVNSFFIIPEEGDFSQWLQEHHKSYSILPVPRWVSVEPCNLRQKVRLLGEITRSTRLIRDWIDTWNIDIVYTNTSVTPVGRMVARSARLPHIWHIREFGDLDFSLRYILPKWLCRWFIRTSTAIICNSEAVRHYYFNNKPYNHVHVIYNGIATRSQFDTYREKASSLTTNPVYTFLIIGSLSAKKGQNTALRALAELRQRGIRARLLVAGSGRESSRVNLLTLAAELGITGDVEFLGYISDPYEAYFKSDCLLMCSEHEAFGRVSAEAMSACLPVIGRNSGGNPEVIEDGKTGFLYNTFDELVDYMEKLVQDPQLSRRMGLAGWQRAKEKFNIEEYAANVYQVIQSVMK